MKKIFLFTSALLVSATMMAQLVGWSAVELSNETLDGSASVESIPMNKMIFSLLVMPVLMGNNLLYHLTGQHYLLPPIVSERKPQMQTLFLVKHHPKTLLTNGLAPATAGHSPVMWLRLLLTVNS